MQEPFRILHLAATDRGGLGHSASRLHASLLALGHDSTLLVKDKDPKIPGKSVFEVKTDLPPNLRDTDFSVDVFQRWYIDHNRTSVSNSMFTLGETGLPLENHPLVEEADILHLHSVSRFLSPASIARLTSLGKPIVWTLHDMRPFTGGCHFSAGCQKFTATCAGCPQLGWDPYFITEAQLADQLEAIPASRITCVTPTEWLANKARASTMFRDNRVEVIPYGVQTEHFPLRWKPQAKNYLGLDPGTLHLLFVANRLGEMRKGFEHLARAIQICLERPDFKAKAEKGQIALISLGHPHPSLATLGIPYVCLGYLESIEEMSQLYGAADLFLLPSLEENSPNTLLEAMSSGTPPIAFGVGGIPELVADETGKLVPPGAVEAYAAAIELLLFRDDLRQTFSENCRRVVQERFTASRQAADYDRLYREILKKDGATSRKTSDSLGFSRGNSHVVTKLAPIGARLQQICADSLPRPLQNLIISMDRQTQVDQAEIREMREFMDGQQLAIQQLQAELDQHRGALRKQETTILHQNQILGSSAIKMLRQLKLIKK